LKEFGKLDQKMRPCYEAGFLYLEQFYLCVLAAQLKQLG
jgi:hypothetical protein